MIGREPRLAFGEDAFGPVVEIDTEAAGDVAYGEEQPPGDEKPEADYDHFNESHAASFSILTSVLASIFMAAISQSPLGVLDCT